MGNIVIADYDPRWPELYTSEAARLIHAFGPLLVSLEHIGSTSIPGLAAKPILDFQAIVHSVPAVAIAAPAIVALGWAQGVFGPDPERHLYFKRNDAHGARTHQLHVYEPDYPTAAAHLLFRDYLRMHWDEAMCYENLKRDLALQFRDDRLGYNDAKTAYIESVLEKAREYQCG